MSLFLVDDQGEMWRGDSRQLRTAFDTPYSGGEFIEYSVKNLGFVAINVYGSSCQVRLRPRFVAEKSFMGLIDWVRKTKVERAVITTFEQGWRDELVQTEKAVSRLEQLVAAAQPTRPADFLFKPLPPATFDRQSQLSDIVQSWPLLVDSYEQQTLVRLLRSVFDNKYVVVRKPNAQDKILFQEFGEGMYTRYETWRNCAIGAPIEEQPDRSYGRWIAGLYKDVLGAHTPRIDAVDAIIRHLDNGRHRRRYRRLIFPLASQSTGQLLFCGSFDDATVDLRVSAL